MDTIDNLKESVKSSEQSGSGDKNSDTAIKDGIAEWEPILKDENEPILIGADDLKQKDIDTERRKVIELSNESVLHGYDMAMELLAAAKQMEAFKVLAESREVIELGLKNSIDERMQEINANSKL